MSFSPAQDGERYILPPPAHPYRASARESGPHEEWANAELNERITGGPSAGVDKPCRVSSVKRLLVSAWKHCERKGCAIGAMRGHSTQRHAKSSAVRGVIDVRVCKQISVLAKFYELLSSRVCGEGWSGRRQSEPKTSAKRSETGGLTSRGRLSVVLATTRPLLHPSLPPSK